MVVAIIATLIGLLLPAVQSVRESARQTGCRNNLRQMGIAMHHHETVRRRLPPGYQYIAGPEGNARGFSWGCLLLPFLEEASLFGRFRLDLPIYDPANQSAREQHLAAFLCPSDPVSPAGFVVMGEERYAMASYVANFGPPDLDAHQEQRLGVFSRSSGTRIGEITDGLSKTFLAGERQNGPFRVAGVHGNHFEYETTWAGAVRDIDDAGDDHGHMVLFQTGHVPNDPLSDDRDVSAAHSGTAQFLLCDGAVRPVEETVDFAIYTALGTRAAGEGAGMP